MVRDLPDSAVLVRRLRLRLGLTQEEMDARVGMGRGVTNRIENGRRRAAGHFSRRLSLLADGRSDEVEIRRLIRAIRSQSRRDKLSGCYF